MVDFEGMRTIEDWGKWKKALSSAVKIGQAVGMSDKTIDKIGFRVGNILAAAVDPENREERLLQQLWEVGDDEDRKSLAKMIVKLVETDSK